MATLIGRFELFIGSDSLESLVSRMRIKGYESGLAFVDKNIANHFRVLEILNFLKSENIDISVQIVDLAGEPTYEDLDKFFNLAFQAEFEFLLAFGGGSVIDLAKGVSVLLKNPGPGIALRGVHKVVNPGVPLVVFPTTAGTGTEMTWTASFTDSESEIKMGINGDNVFPSFGVLDPKLLIGAPKKVLMSAALDTLVHAIESVTSKMSNPFVQQLGVSAVNRVLENLVQALESEPSLKSLELLQIAAAEAGLAMLNSSGGPASGISYPLGVHFKVPHGFAGGLLLPEVIRENVKLGYSGYSLFDSAENSDSLLVRIEQLFADVGAPKDFSEWGFKSTQDLERIVSLTLSQRSDNLKLNPVEFTETNIISVLKRFIN